MNSGIIFFLLVIKLLILKLNASIHWEKIKWARGCDFKNKDLSNKKVRREDCDTLCSKTLRCTHYTWTTYNGGTCWMKHGRVNKKDALETYDKTMICGIVSASESMDVTFPTCLFKSGQAFDPNISDYSSPDYLTIWINTISSDYGTDFNPYYQGAMIDICKKSSKIPVFYAYIIAFQARKDKGLQDCNIDPDKNLCFLGADYIRNNRQLLVERYTHQASKIAERLGSDGLAIFLMEPDFWQYHGDNRQTNGPLSGDFMAQLFNDFVTQIKIYLPNALISWDISAWIGEDGFKEWFGFFKNSQIDFINTSGGQAQGDSSNIRPNELTWSFVSEVTGKKIIADCGYGAGGGASDNCGVWLNSNNLNSRVIDGVIALSQPSGYKPLPIQPNLC